MSDIFEAPKPKQTNIEAGQTRMYHGKDGYKRVCEIKKLLENDRFRIELEGRIYDAPKWTIGELCD